MTTRFALLETGGTPGQVNATATSSTTISNSELGGENYDAAFVISTTNSSLNTIQGPTLTNDQVNYCWGFDGLGNATDTFWRWAYRDGAALSNNGYAFGRINEQCVDLNDGTANTNRTVRCVANSVPGVDTFSLYTSTNTNSTTPYFSAGAFNGNGVSVYREEFAGTGQAQNSTITVTPGFVADVVIFLGHGGSIEAQGTANLGNSVGVAVNDGSLTQRCYTFGFSGSSDPTAFATRLYTSDTAGASGDTLSTYSRRVGSIIKGSSGIQYEFECTSFTAGAGSNEVEFTVRGAANDSDGFFEVICLKSTDWIFRLIDFDLPTSGNTSISTPGINLSQGGLMRWFTPMTAANTEDTTTGLMTGFDMHDGTLHHGIAASSEDNVSTTAVARCVFNDGSLRTLKNDGTAGHVGTTALSSTGWADTLSSHTASATKNFALAFGPASGSNETVYPFTGPWR